MNKLAEETKVEKEVTEEVEENKEAEAEVVEEEKVDQEDQIKILQGEVDKWKNDYTCRICVIRIS